MGPANSTLATRVPIVSACMPSGASSALESFDRAHTGARPGVRFVQQSLRRLRRATLVLWLVAGLLAAPAAQADDGVFSSIGSVGEAVFDVIILRPLGAAATAGGFGVFLITAPLLAPSREVPYGWETFVLGPYEYTVERPLGDF